MITHFEILNERGRLLTDANLVDFDLQNKSLVMVFSAEFEDMTVEDLAYLQTLVHRGMADHARKRGLRHEKSIRMVMREPSEDEEYYDEYGREDNYSPSNFTVVPRI